MPDTGAYGKGIRRTEVNRESGAPPAGVVRRCSPPPGSKAPFTNATSRLHRAFTSESTSAGRALRLIPPPARAGGFQVEGLKQHSALHRVKGAADRYSRPDGSSFNFALPPATWTSALRIASGAFMMFMKLFLPIIDRSGKLVAMRNRAYSA